MIQDIDRVVKASAENILDWSYERYVGCLRTVDVIETIPVWLVVWPDLTRHMLGLAVNSKLYEYAYLVWYILMRLSGGLFSGVKNRELEEYIRHHGIPDLEEANLKRVKSLGNGLLWTTTRGRYAKTRAHSPGEMFENLGVTMTYKPRAMRVEALETSLDVFLAYQFNSLISPIDVPISRRDLAYVSGLQPQRQCRLQKLITPPREDGNVIVGETNVIYRPIPDGGERLDSLKDQGWQVRDDSLMRRTANSYITCQLPEVKVTLDGRVVVADTLDDYTSVKFFAREDDAEKVGQKRDPYYLVWDGSYTFTKQGGREPRDGWPSGERPTLIGQVWSPGRESKW